jgi:hypothetical protein
MSTMRPTLLETVPESLPADHVTQSAQPSSVTAVAAVATTTEKNIQAVTSEKTPQPGQTPAVASLKPRSSSSRVSVSVECMDLYVE